MCPAAREMPAEVWSVIEELLRREINMLVSLRSALEFQRQAIAASDTKVVDETVERIATILENLAEARNERQAVVSRLLNTTEKLSDFVNATPETPVSVVDLVTELQSTAADVGRETQINKRILKSTIDSSELFLRAVLAAATDDEPGYAATAGTADQAQSSVFLNRTA